MFTATPYRGNPVAVVLDADGLTSQDMQQFANWTNLSETTFVLPPSTEQADYRVRIFTPTAELPFAGHPTLGTCHAWLEAGGKPAAAEVFVQECGAGLVEIRQVPAGLAFAAPPLIRVRAGGRAARRAHRRRARHQPGRHHRPGLGRQRAGLGGGAAAQRGGGARAAARGR